MSSPIVLWTARIAAAAWLGRWVVHWGCRPGPTTHRLIRWLWTIGCLVYLGHVAAAFHLVHDWSHAAAWEQTARQTRAVTGLNWGGGLWFNYAFTLLWPLDVIRGWQSPTDFPDHSAASRAIQAYLAFIVVNATLIFGPRWWWAAFAAAAAATWMLRRCTRHDFPAPGTSGPP